MLGEQLSPQEVDIARDLYKAQIPARWLSLMGIDMAPPASYPLSTLITDLSARAQHLEKALTLVLMRLYLHVIYINTRN